jgi:hypothetical protein
MLDNRAYADKPNDQETRLAVKQVSTQSISIPQLAQKLALGFSCRPGLLEGGSSDSNWVGQQCFFLDIDSHVMTVREALDLAKAKGIAPNIVYPSSRFKPSDQRFHMAFVADEIIRDAKLRDKIQQQLMKLYRCDPRTGNRSRIFYGGQALFWVDDQSRLQIPKILEV